MFRSLKPIEIAEGALLADIAVICHLLVVFVPFFGDVFRVPIFIVFAILVLRRSLYVGSMALGVALFIAGVLTGPGLVMSLLLEGMGGLYLGLAMKLHMPHYPLIILGAIAGALSFFSLILVVTAFAGIPITIYVTSLHRLYNVVLPQVAHTAQKLGIGTWWHVQALPLVSSLSNLAFTYWVITWYLLFWLLLCPFVLVMYMATNISVRMLGYEVRAFPGGRINKLIYRLRRRLAKMAVRVGVIRRHGARA